MESEVMDNCMTCSLKDKCHTYQTDGNIIGLPCWKPVADLGRSENLINQLQNEVRILRAGTAQLEKELFEAQRRIRELEGEK